MEAARMNLVMARRVIKKLFGERVAVEVGAFYRRLKAIVGLRRTVGSSQSNEEEIIDRLIEKCSGIPLTFCEFGFDVAELNCGRLARKGWRGLLIDGDQIRVRTAQKVLARDRISRVHAVHSFLDLTNLLPTVEDFFRDEPLGVLSIDVDGNDYWFLQELIVLRPSLILVEYNASFGSRSVAVPYDRQFFRHQKHPSGWYHGASITALTKLCREHEYSLVATSQDGLNLFFLEDRHVGGDLTKLDARDAYRENALRNSWSKTTAEQQWTTIQRLPFVDV